MIQAQTESVVVAYFRGKKRVLGKILSLPEATVFHRSWPREEMSASNLSLDLRGWWLILKDSSITELHFENLNTLYIIGKEHFAAQAQVIKPTGEHELAAAVPIEHWTQVKPWYTTTYDRLVGERVANEPVPENLICHAQPPELGGPGPNYLEPHTPADAEREGKPAKSCTYCGRWLDPT
jgi:hypothetical protein